jgi:hypothetical protein
LDVEPWAFRRYASVNIRILGFSILATLIAINSIRAEPAAEQQVRDAIKASNLTVVHLWAPWCANCPAC